MKTKILMFEDDNFTVDFNTLLFVNEGYEVRCYQDVDDVIERVKAYDPSIILMDLRIPSIGGAEA
ncbi:MAG: response regulator, partial [bacterium]